MAATAARFVLPAIEQLLGAAMVGIASLLLVEAAARFLSGK
jgi:hypothetical protein